MTAHRTIRPLALLLALALVVRVAVALVAGTAGPPVEDERGYVLLARSLAAGEGLALPVPGEVIDRADVQPVPPRTAFRGPLLPLFLTPLVKAGATPSLLRWVSVLLGSLGPPLLYLALRQGSLSRAAPWAAGAYALWPPAAYLSVRILSEPLSQALLLGALALFAAPAPLRERRAAGAGALAALAVLTRPAALLPAVLVAFTRDRRAAALYLLALVFVMTPWLWRNHAEHDRLLFTTNSGVTLVGGNSAAAAAADPAGKWLAPGEVYAGAEDPPDLGMWGWSRLGETGSDARFRQDALEWAGGNPGTAAGLALRKVVRLFDPDPHSRKPDAGRKRLLGWLSMGPVLLLLLPGLLDVRRRAADFAPWTALFVGTLVTAVLFYGDTRMRTCADPALLAVAAAGGWAIVGWIRSRREPGPALGSAPVRPEKRVERWVP